MARLPTIIERLRNPKLSAVERLQRECFLNVLKDMNFNRASGLSVSCGDGIWDYLALASPVGFSSITATDIVKCPVSSIDVQRLQSQWCWNFIQVKPNQPLPFDRGFFDVCFSMDVIEHTRRPFLFLTEQHRVLRGGGRILVGTPNLFRPANIVRACVGKLCFPMVIGHNNEIGAYVHEQEFHEQQLIIMLEEAGFADVTVRALYFGPSMLNVSFCDYPERGASRIFAHFLLATGYKR